MAIVVPKSVRIHLNWFEWVVYGSYGISTQKRPWNKLRINYECSMLFCISIWVLITRIRLALVLKWSDIPVYSMWIFQIWNIDVQGWRLKWPHVCFYHASTLFTKQELFKWLFICSLVFFARFPFSKNNNHGGFLFAPWVEKSLRRRNALVKSSICS